MRQLKVSDMMQREVVTVSPRMSVKEVAKLFTDKGISGAPVVDDEGRLVGIVTDRDLIMEDVRVHFPTYIQFLDGIFYLGGFRRFEEELRKAVGATVEDVMTHHVVTADESATVEDVATLLVERGFDRIPIVREGRLVGLVTKADIVRTLAR